MRGESWFRQIDCLVFISKLNIKKKKKKKKKKRIIRLYDVQINHSSFIFFVDTIFRLERISQSIIDQSGRVCSVYLQLANSLSRRYRTPAVEMSASV